MKTIDSIPRMVTFARMMRKEGKAIGFVPTMGYLHEGHASLIRTARKHTDIVIISIFVNPIQFSPNEDFDKYPRDFKRDEEIARLAGTDVIFYPSAKEMYPDTFATYVNVERLTDTLCGATRPGHFRGVTTVVAKLFGIVKPDIAYFGQKDAQQSVVIRKMVEDLNMGVEIKVLPTVREDDGLAMSSRNAYLSADERKDAAILFQSLKKAQDAIEAGEADAKKVVKMMEEMILSRQGHRIEYIRIVDTKSLADIKTIAGQALIALAVRIGTTRLIDNVMVNNMPATGKEIDESGRGRRRV